MQIMDVNKAKTQFFKLMDAVIDGDEIIITKEGKPVAKLGPVEKSPRRFGLLKGKIKISKNFDEPLSK